MKNLFIIALLLFSLSSSGQIPGRLEEYIDTIKWQGISPDFVRHSCKHIFVAVEPTEIKAGNGTDCLGRSGKQEGKEIVCIKCHYITRQVVDYGDGFYMPRYGISIPIDTPNPYVRSRISDGAIDLITPTDWKKLVDSTGNYILGSTLLNADYPQGKIWISNDGPCDFTQFNFPDSAYKDRWRESVNEVPTKHALYDKIKSLSDKKKKCSCRCHK